MLGVGRHLLFYVEVVDDLFVVGVAGDSFERVGGCRSRWILIDRLIHLMANAFSQELSK